jgi:hypothetical protein
MLITPLFTLQPYTTDVISNKQHSSDLSVSLDSIPVPQTPRTVRVAIYNEPNLTAPTYATHSGAINNNATDLAAMLNGHGVQTTLLDVHDIYNHELQTASYDVLALVDNFPRENITNQVQEFWLGGGGILTFDGAADFLCYFGILPPESAGGTGWPTYWDFGSANITVNLRHPVTKAYSVGDTIETALGYLYWDWPTISGSIIGSDCIRIANPDNDANGCNVLGFDPTDRGGKIITFAYDFSYEVLPGLHQMIVDAVDWLCPRPKGRIVFDLTVQPYQGVDPWDDLAYFPSYYEDWRNDLVARGYLFDKLYPTAGTNITEARLAPYDMLVECLPRYNFTAAEVSAVENWVQDGGGLYVMGDNSILVNENNHINYLLSNLDLAIYPDLDSGVMTYFVEHPITEGCSSLRFVSASYINYTGSGYPIWGPSASDAFIGGAEPGSGRVILAGDINWIDDGYYGDEDNSQFAINMVNWLTTATARVLVYTDWGGSANYYRTPVALALNELQVNFYLTTDLGSPMHAAWNHSLHRQSWDLVIVDSPSWAIPISYLDELVGYIDAGGHLLFSYYDGDGSASHPVYARMGCHPLTDVTTQPPLYIWDAGHHIFTQPIAYGANNFTFGTAYLDDGDRCTVYANATALAGHTASPTASEAYIILRNDGQTIYNAYLLDEFSGDTDDSTYMDSMELWTNEIAFMLRPQCNFNVILPPNATLGDTFPVTVEINNDGLGAALEGSVTITVPGSLGTLMDPVTLPFNIPPGGADVLTWHIEVTGIGSYSLSFSADYHGLPGTMYSHGPFSGTLDTFEPTLPPTPTLPPGIPGFPIEAIAIGAIIALGAGIVYRRRKR